MATGADPSGRSCRSRADIACLSGVHPRCRWKGISNTPANIRPKHAVTGSRIATSTKNIGVPEATRPRTSPVGHGDDDGRAREVEAVGAAAEAPRHAAVKETYDEPRAREMATAVRKEPIGVAQARSSQNKLRFDQTEPLTTIYTIAGTAAASP